MVIAKWLEISACEIPWKSHQKIVKNESWLLAYYSSHVYDILQALFSSR